MFGLIGAGNMGGAILRGILKQHFIQPEEVLFFDPNEQLSKQMIETLGVASAQSNRDLAERCDRILLAVKPVYLAGVIDEIRDASEGKVILSIAAGWCIEKLQNAFGKNHSARILRIMPNTPALVGAGYTALCAETTLTPEELLWAKELFSAVGQVELVPERLFDAVIAVSGSSPAYIFMLIEAMADGAVRLGMSRSMAIEAAAQAVLGSAKMVLDTHQHPAVLKDQVCSPGGTTIEAVQALEQSGFRGAVMEAMNACAEKSRLMNKE